LNPLSGERVQRLLDRGGAARYYGSTSGRRRLNSFRDRLRKRKIKHVKPVAVVATV